ncbi:hypothetical protein DL1_06950 [Thioclava dalianensis]|uniref:Uncharacterized protein n=1 Tax=Thioclava dalianensis TaxID=1185766 RepID=A0A074TMD9_9RHOB|nr:hypothetical protein [Thioclava dalianensis]KEP71325.1 hypothetical protein DL1_06950 [Thioclava dalianensis]SFM77393.1 hypothetical protein SAMN05216224_101236 [Thioclava dalianensis]
MKIQDPTDRPRTILIVIGGVAGAAVAIYNYVTPLTGVNGTSGAALVIATSILIVLAAIVVQLLAGGFLRALLRTLIVLGILGTAAAGYFLHEWWLMGAMAVALIGVIFDAAATRGSAKGAYA